MIGIGLGVSPNLGLSAPGGSALDYTKLVVLGDSTVAKGWRQITANVGDLSYSGTVATLTTDGLVSGTPITFRALAGNTVWGFKQSDPIDLAVRTISDLDITTYGTTSQPAFELPYTGTGPTSGAIHLLSQLSALTFLHHWNARNGCPVDMTLGGVSGGFAVSLDDMIANSVTGTDAGIVLIAAGINDFAWLADSAANVYSYISSAVATLRAQGRRVILSTVLPYPFDPTISGKVADLNTLIRAMSFDADFVLLDAYDTIDDGAGGTLTGRLYDNVHYAPLGGDEVATAMQTAVSGWSLPSRADALLATVADEGLVNGDFSGTGGTHGGAWSTGTLADNWRTARTSTTATVVASKAARGDGEGDNQTLTITTTGAGTAALRTESIHASYTPGTAIYAVAEVSISNLGSQFQSLRVGIHATDSDTVAVGGPGPTGEYGVAQWGAVTGDNGADVGITAAQAQQANRTFTITTPPVTMTDTLTDLRLDIRIEFLGAVTNAVMTVGRATIYEATS